MNGPGGLILRIGLVFFFLQIFVTFFLLYKETFVWKISSLETISSDPIEPSIFSIKASEYAYADVSSAKDQKQNIDLNKENKEVSRFIQQKKEVSVFIVPGFMPPWSSPMKTNRVSEKRMNKAVELLSQAAHGILLVSGGNVKPVGTPYNEALEMKKFLMEKYKIPEQRIAIDPYSQNTVTNLRNCGRFLLAHGIREAVVVTTFVQNLYIAFSQWSTFALRSQKMLGYKTGDIEFVSEMVSTFQPSQDVFQKGDDPLDP